MSAAAAVGATAAETASWIFAICLAKAAGSAFLSTSQRVPVVLAWSTPGAALIAGTSGIAMAEAVRTRSGASFGLSTTGIAGPGGGSEEKPVGLVWIGLSAEGFADAWRYDLGTDRGRTRTRATQAALELLRRRLLGLPLPTTPSE